MTIKTYRLPAAALLAAAVTVPLVMFRTGLLAPEQPQTFTAADGLPNGDIAVLPTDEPWSSTQPRLQIADSLSGTSHGVALISRDDELRVTAGLRDLFDYYLSAVGELSLNTIRGNIQQALQQQLSGPALQQAYNIMDNYLAYKSALVEFEQQYQQPQFDAADWDNTRRIRFMNERQQALTALQDRWLGADVADVFFAFDRRLDNNTLARAEILNSSLNDAEKSQALVNLQAELPIGMQLQRQRDQQQKQLLAIDRAELSESEKFQQRAEVVGEAAAQRLQALDQQRAQWQQRLEGFRQVVNQLQQANLAPDDYQREYQALLEQHFAAHERVRAQALTN